MPVDESNQGQADLWTTSGTTWVELRDRFDGQSGAHGDAAMDALAPRKGERIIDLGCGPGSTTAELARRVGPSGSVVGLDISPTMIEGAKAYAAAAGRDNLSFAVSDAMAEPFSGDADGVYSRFGLMFFSDAHAGFANVRNALRLGGRLATTCWQSPLENPWISEAFGVAARYLELPFSSEPTAPGPFSLADPDRIRTVLSEAGYADVEVEEFRAPSIIGPDAADAAAFMMKLLPGSVTFAAEDPDGWAALTNDLAAEVYAQWAGPNGIEAPSASWTVTATNPVTPA